MVGWRRSIKRDELGQPDVGGERTRVGEQRARSLRLAAGADEQVAELEAHARRHRTPAHALDGKESAFVAMRSHSSQSPAMPAR